MLSGSSAQTGCGRSAPLVAGGKSEIEQRSAHQATESLRRTLERKESALRINRTKFEQCQQELRESREAAAAAKAEAEAAKRAAHQARREARHVGSTDGALGALAKGSKQAQELKLLLFQLVHVGFPLAILVYDVWISFTELITSFQPF